MPNRFSQKAYGKPLTLGLVFATLLSCQLRKHPPQDTATSQLNDAYELPDERLNYASLTTRIKKHQIQSLDQFLNWLAASPHGKEFFSRSLLVFDSNSLHLANIDSRENVRFPRVVLYSRDASLMMAYSTHPDDTEKESLEIIEYSFKQAQFEFFRIQFGARLITFQDGREHLTTNTFRHVPKNSDCEACHAGTPNWDSYPLWPGVYGSNDDKISWSSQEDLNYSEFLKYRMQHPRLAPLRALYSPSELERLRSLHKGNSSIMALGYPFKKDSYFESNIGFTNLVSYLNYHRMAHMLMKKLPKWRYAIIAIAGNCPNYDDFIPGFTEDKFTQTLKRIHKQRWQYQSEKHQAVFGKDQTLVKLDFDHATRATGALAMLLEPKGIDIGDWNMNFGTGSYDFIDGDGELYGLSRALARIALNNEKPPLHRASWGYNRGNWPESEVNWDTKFESPFPIILTSGETPEICQSLAQRHRPVLLEDSGQK